MFFFRKLKMIYLIFKNAMNPLPEYVFEMSNTAARMLKPDEVEAILQDIYSKHPKLGELLAAGKTSFETDLKKLASLPVGTLGHTYAEHMLSQGLDPGFYSNSKFADHDVAGKKWEHFRIYSLQSHDVWHVLSGYKTDYLGEIGVFSFLFGQIQLSLYLLIPVSISMHTIFGRKRHDCLQAFENLSHGFRMGRSAKSCIGLDWDHYWARELSHVRSELGIQVSPN